MHTEQQGQTALHRPFAAMRNVRACFQTGKHIPRAITLLVLAVMCLALAAPAQAAKKVQETEPPAAAKTSEARVPADDIAESIMERARPSDKDNISVLRPLDGIWDYTESFWTDPKATPEHAMGTVTNQMVLDQRFLSSKASGNLNIGREQIPFEGQGMIGYDNVKKAFSSVWADTTTTGLMIGGGKYDDKKHLLAETGHFTNPLTGIDEGFRSELHVTDADHYQQTIFAVSKAGKESKLMEIEYTKRQ